MNSSVPALIVLISPLVFIITALASFYQPGLRPALMKRLSVGAAIVNIIIAAVGSLFVYQYDGYLETATYGLNGIGFSLRLDPLSMLMSGMIALLSFIVIRYSLNYLDGDKRQGAFLGRLAATIASVQLLVLAGNLGLLFVAWVLTSMSLHRLLVFYKERHGAIIAARKKFIVARLGDASLLAAILVLYNQFNTGNLEIIFQGIKETQAAGTTFAGLEWVAIFLAFAALLKSAQFPTHGWLVEVMETPTPVSALLHAGLLNAGPFLIIRMAFVMEATTYASLFLIIIGGFTALFASVVFLTQTSIKTALGYSSAAHMGFSLMVCGLGVFPAAMLHMVAHSFYKAHAFLSSGSVIDALRGAKVAGATRVGNPFKIALGIALGFAVYALFAFAWGIDPETELPLLAIGAVISMGLARLFTGALDSTGSIKLFLRATLLSLTVATSFFVLETASHFLLMSQFPEMATPSVAEVIMISIMLTTFGTAVFLQILAPTFANKPSYQALAIHLRNGLYMNTLFDRVVRALYTYGEGQQPEAVTKFAKQEADALMAAEVLEKQTV
jgi:NAD(P)H-quinone oxidoreductase subunit 5